MSSYGQELLKRYLTLMLDETPRENYRPNWLHGMELDLYFDSLNLGVEFQGDQHYIPVFGVSSCSAQKWRDRSKKAICRDLGVRFLCLEAIDLQYGRIVFKLRRVCAGIPGFRKFINRPAIRRRLRELNKLAIEYRHTLKNNYGSLTARRKGFTRRMAKYEWMKANGFHCAEPTSPSVRKAARRARRLATLAHKEKLAAQGLAMLPA